MARKACTAECNTPVAEVHVNRKGSPKQPNLAMRAVVAAILCLSATGRIDAQGGLRICGLRYTNVLICDGITFMPMDSSANLAVTKFGECDSSSTHIYLEGMIASHEMVGPLQLGRRGLIDSSTVYTIKMDSLKNCILETNLFVHTNANVFINGSIMPTQEPTGTKITSPIRTIRSIRIKRHLLRNPTIDITTY